MTRRGWSARYAAARQWVPPEGVEVMVFANEYSGRVWAVLRCGNAMESVVVCSEDLYTIGSALDSVSMDLLMYREEAMAAEDRFSQTMWNAQRTFLRAMAKIGGRA
jgi:hypothetical protein